MTRIWEVEISERNASALRQRFHVSAPTINEAIKKATKRSEGLGRITKVVLIAEAE